MNFPTRAALAEGLRTVVLAIVVTWSLLSASFVAVWGLTPVRREEIVPIYVILPDTTRLNMNSFNWKCTIEPLPRRIQRAPVPTPYVPDTPPSRQAGR